MKKFQKPTRGPWEALGIALVIAGTDHAIAGFKRKADAAFVAKAVAAYRRRTARR